MLESYIEELRGAGLVFLLSHLRSLVFSGGKRGGLKCGGNKSGGFLPKFSPNWVISLSYFLVKILQVGLEGDQKV